MLQQFGHYLLDEEIARGGMARVYRARLRGLAGFEKPLVVKQVLPELARDPRFVRMFVEEAKTLVQMSHPHIVSVYELGVVDGVYFLAMEHVDGATLAEVLKDGPLGAALLAQVALQVCDALEYAHRRFGLVHRDVSPRNVMIDASGHARLLDFGIAAPASGADEAAHVFGSPGYMSPEQARGAAIDAKSDLFSLGAVSFEALTGNKAFLRGTPAATRAALLEEPPPRLSENDAVPPELARLVERLLERDPRDRPATAAEVARQLRSWLAAHHPEGVGAELGRRVEAVRTRHAAQSRSSQDGHGPPAAGDSLDEPPSGESGVKTLATSLVLSAALGENEATAPIPGRGVTSSSGGREGRGWRWVAVIGAGAGVIALASVALVRAPPAPNAGARSASQATIEKKPPTDPGKNDVPPASSTTPLPEPAAGTHRSREEGAGLAKPAPAASLTVNARPWAEVRLDGRPIGTTPRRGIHTSAGDHVVELSCPPLGRSARVQVHLEVGSGARILADLMTDPPTIRVY